jgi:broad specificity phosphatase PhoE/ribonuclease HI
VSRRRLVVEADGGSRGNPGQAAYGALVRDAETGELLAEVAERIGVATNNVAEYRGLIAGLVAARDIDPDAQVEVRMDSKLVVEQMAGRWRVKHPSMRPLALRARSAFPYEQVRWTWVPRERNRHADALANQALDGKPIGLGPSPVAEPADEDPLDLPAPAPRRGWTPDLGDPTALVLLRHGETEHTVELRFSGRGGADPGLVEAGWAQARAAGAAVAAGSSDVAAVVTSPLRRTRETAEAVAEVLGAPVEVEPDLAECAFGEWDGLTYAQVHERWPEELRRWLWSTDVAPPGGESLAQVERRVSRSRDAVLARHVRRRVVVVSHVTPVNLLVRMALDAPMTAVFRMALAPASLSEVHYWADGVASLRSYNVTTHLR